MSDFPQLDGQLFVGIKFGHDGANVALSIAVRTADDKIFLEAYACRPFKSGIVWIIDFLSKADIAKVVVDGKNGTGLMEDAMKVAGLKKPVIPTVSQVIKANASFEMGLASNSIRHMDQSAVTQIVSNCEKRAIGAGGGFGYRSILEGADIAILDSMIFAHWICEETPKARKKQTVSY